MTPAAEPFRVDVPEEQLDDMRRRIRTTRWADDFGNQDWYYGVERGWLEEMVGYWADGYDWRAAEAEINSVPAFKVELDSVPIHFLHVRGKGPDPRPLILTHGWPWTFWDFSRVIGPLTDPGAHGGDPADAFDVVVPSLPGFGFSTPLRTTGVDARVVAGLWTRLMREVLGYDRFGAVGGDWGAIVTGEIGHGYAEHLDGVYMTLPMLPGVNLRAVPREAFAEDEQWMYERAQEARPFIQSHRTVHQHEPQTIAYALADSPTGTAAWLWARRRDWSDCDGDPLSVFSRDFLCTTASIYWLTGTIATSLRLYRENFGRGQLPPLHDRKRVIDAPTGFGVFRKELLMLPRSMAAELTDLRHWSVLPKGGHFAPAEQPALFADDVRAFFSDLRRGAEAA